MRTAILIPARYNSSRFPGKMLTNLNGITLIERVYQSCIQTCLDTYVLTDHSEISDKFDSKNVIKQNPSSSISNGTERCQAALSDQRLQLYDSFINVQGDMPDVTPEIIIAVRRLLKKYELSTAYTDLPPDRQKDPNTVKALVYDDELEWCCRGFTTGYQHLGIYGYSKHALAKYPVLPSSAEIRSNLEQLRWLENRFIIGATKVQFNGIEINTSEDADLWMKIRTM
jgi:3-deoxy-manno-octulosonate cytidylyltransferase (CMP-KDO synthetase)